MITKEDLITGFKNSCVLHTQILRRSIAVKYQFQRNIWEIDNMWMGRLRIEDIGKYFIKLYPLLNNKFNAKEVVKFEIDKREFEELRALYWGDFKQDMEYFNRFNKLYSKH